MTQSFEKTCCDCDYDPWLLHSWLTCTCYAFSISISGQGNLLSPEHGFDFNALKEAALAASWPCGLSVSSSVDPQNISWAFSKLSVSWCCRRRRAKEINENNETDLQKYAPKKKQQQQKAKVKQRETSFCFCFSIFGCSIFRFSWLGLQSVCAGMMSWDGKRNCQKLRFACSRQQL